MFPLNTAEQKLQLIYLISALLITSIIINSILFRNQGLPDTNTRLLTEQIARQQKVQRQQSQYLPEIDTIYKTITRYQPQISAVYMDVEIETQLTKISSYWDNQAGTFHEKIRYRAFDQVADFYQMFYFDKRILWSLQQNRLFFNKQLEDCNTGVQPMTGIGNTVIQSTR